MDAQGKEIEAGEGRLHVAEGAAHTHVSSWGYACFLTVNATSIWGGVFPFLPMEFQTAEVTLTFFLAQSLAFWGAFVASAVGSYRFPHGARRMLVSLSAILVFAGSACLIGAMYVFEAVLVLVAAGGVLLGIGCAGLFMLWQRYFASLPPAQGNVRLVVGTALAPFIYFALYLVPIALTAFLVPLVFVPLCGLCIALSVREMRMDQPMFEDVPRQHPQVYRQVVSDYWRSALCVGSLAFASGVIRGIALLHQEISLVVNSASMLGSFVSAAVLLLLWRRMSFRLGLTSVFRVVYPLVITGFLLLPFLGAGYLNLFAAFTYMVFSLVLMLMMMQCAQVSRDRGINPVFIYAFFGAVVYLMQAVGFLLGWVSDFVSVDGFDWLFFVAMVSSYVLGITLLVSTGTLFKAVASKGDRDGGSHRVFAPRLRRRRRTEPRFRPCKGRQARQARQGRAKAPQPPQRLGRRRRHPRPHVQAVPRHAGGLRPVHARDGGHGAHRPRQQHGEHRRAPGHQREHGAHPCEAHLHEARHPQAPGTVGHAPRAGGVGSCVREIADCDQCTGCLLREFYRFCYRAVNVLRKGTAKTRKAT